MSNSMPFSRGNIQSVIQQIKDELVKTISSLDVITEIEKLKDDLVEKYKLETVGIEKNKITRDHSEKKHPSGVSGIQTTFFVPINGGYELIEYYGSTHRLPKNYMSIDGRSMSLSYTSSTEDAENTKSKFKTDLEDIKFNLESLNKDITAFNIHLVNFIELELQKRVAQLGKNKEFVESFEYPLRKDNRVEPYFRVPVKKKRLDINKTATAETKKQEYLLSKTDYEEILRSIHDMSLVFERSPKAFQDMEEEILRFLLLVPLNGLFPGAASGETFNYEGQTDILIRYKGKNIFIAECKFWTGEKGLHDAIDQILKYLSWRDTKTAIILFNRNKNLTDVLDKIPGIVTQHANCERQLEWDNYETGTRYQLHHRDDQEKKLTLSVIVFDVPKHD